MPQDFYYKGVAYPATLEDLDGNSLSGDIVSWSAGPNWPTLVAYRLDPILIAHRGGSASWPEMTQQAYFESAVLWNMKAIEVSVQYSADGTAWCLHDNDIGRVTGASGTVSTMTDTALSALTVTAVPTDNPGQHRRPLALLSDILKAYAGKRVLFIEDKTRTHGTELLNVLDANGGPDWFVWKTDGMGALFGDSRVNGRTHVDGKYDSWGYFFNDSMATNFSAKQGNFTYVGVDFNSSDATLTSAISTAGASRVIGHIIPTPSQRDRMLNLGVRGLMIAAVRSCVPHPQST